MKPISNFIIFPFLLFLLLPGCKSEINNTINADNSKVIKVNTSDDNPLSDTLISELDPVFLETDSNCLIGSIFKFVSYKDKFYMQDLRNNTLFVFNTGGKFLFKLTRGRGPGEFLEIRDFQIGHNGDIYVLTYKKIMHYSSSGKFIDDFQFDFVNQDNGFNLNPTNFVMISNKEYYMWGGTLGIDNNDNGLNYALYKINNKKEITGKYFKIERMLMEANRFYKYDNFYYLKPITDVYTIDKIDENGISVAWTIDFGKDALPPDYFPNTFASELGSKIFRLSETNYCYNIDYIHETADYFYFTYYQGIHTKNAIFSKKSGKVIHGDLNIFNCFNPDYFIGVCKSQFVCAVYPYIIQDMLKNKDLGSCLPALSDKQETIKKLRSVKETDNPVLFLVTLKKF